MISFEWVQPERISDTWKLIKPGLEVLEKYNNDWMPEDIYLSLKLATCNLHLALVDDEYKGFMVVQKLENHGLISLHIWVAYSFAKDFDVLQYGTKQLKEWGASIGAKKLTFGTHRKGWNKQALKLGFKQSPIISYELEIDYG